MAMVYTNGDVDPAQEERVPALFCRALYDYQAVDPSSLSFNQNDIIEVLTQQPSGWWDGLLGEERGWFPSNYVAILTDEEAEAALNSSGDQYAHAPMGGPTPGSGGPTNATPTPATMAQHMSTGGGLTNGIRYMGNSSNHNGINHQQFSHHQASSVEQGFVDMNHNPSRGNQSEPEDWSDNEYGRPRGGSVVHIIGRTAELRNGTQPLHIAKSTVTTAPSTAASSPIITHGRTQSSDFWVPQVAQDGRIFYVNTQTGARSRDLPQEPDDYISDGDLAGLTSQSSSRSGTSAGLGFASSDSESGVQRTATPEPWVRRLADDHITPFYYNKMDGTTRWDRPPAPAPRSASQQSEQQQIQQRTYPSSSNKPAVINSNGNESDSHDLYSDDETNDYARLLRQPPINQRLFQRRPPSVDEEHVVMQLTSAEKIAQSLQKALAPSPAELVTDLSAVARGAIQNVVQTVRDTALNGRPYQDQRMDALINSAVDAIRNLLYVSSSPVGQIHQSVLPRQAKDYRPHPSHIALKPAQRKVTATLSRLVLSARAIQYDSGSSSRETLNRLEFDAEELERAVSSFVLEVQRTQHAAIPDERAPKRLYGVFETANIGLGLVGGGAAGGWKGFGWVSLDEQVPPTKTVLRPDTIAGVDARIAQLQPLFFALLNALQTLDETAVETARVRGQDLVTRLSSFLDFVADIHVARHVDVDGIRQDAGSQTNDLYVQNVEKARIQVRALEASTQSIYDDSAALFSLVQKVADSEPGYNPSANDRASACQQLSGLSTTLQTNLAAVKQTLEALLAIGHDQAELARGDYNGSIEWRISRLSFIDNRFGGAVRPISPLEENSPADPEDELIDMETAFTKPTKKIQPGITSGQDGLGMVENGDRASVTTGNTLVGETGSLGEGTINGASSVGLSGSNIPLDGSLSDDEDPLGPPLAKKKDLTAILGTDYKNRPAAPKPPPSPPVSEPQPWFLQPNYDPAEIAIEPDNSIRGGTLPALVERLTAHEQADTTFNQTFLMTYKSFTTLDELFDLLVARFRIQPPEGLSEAELEKWRKLKQYIIQMRVLNIFKSMVSDENILEKEDLYILDRLGEFIDSEDVTKFTASKVVRGHIERLQRGGVVNRTLVNNTNPPQPIYPKSGKALKLLEIDPLELARQITLFESTLYMKIKPMECLQRAREQRTENLDNIAIVIQTSNRIACWVADAILSKDDSRRRAATVKHLISVADRCRSLNNFSTMIAITSGLNTPPIRRLKRTWEQVGQRFMAQFAACEMTIDSNKNFNKYRQLMANITPPCVPFIGIFLSTLQFIQDGNPDMLPGNLVNFRKRQKASEVIGDIKRWQAQPFNFTPIQQIHTYIEEALNKYNDTREQSDIFWNLSLEREPREREDEKMARLLQESGFL